MAESAARTEAALDRGVSDTSVLDESSDDSLATSSSSSSSISSITCIPASSLVRFWAVGSILFLGKLIVD